MTRQRASGWFAVFVAVIFSAGIGTGVILRGYLEARPAASVRTATPNPSIASVTARLASELALNPTQTDRLERILLSRRQRLTALHKDLKARVEGELTDVSREINGMLTPAQRERLQQLVFRMRMRLETP